jgi:hypothetical protein
MIGKSVSRIFAVLALLAAVRVMWVAVAYFQGGRLTRHRLEAAWIAFVIVGTLWIAVSGAFKSKPVEPNSRSGFGISVLLAAYVAGSVALYWRGIWIGLLSDDFSLTSKATASILRGTGWEHYRPLPLLAWKLLFPLGAAPALHLLNVVLHGINAWLVAGLAARLGHRPPLAALTGVIFLTFPGAVEPVAWSSGIFDVAMVTFGLLYLRASIAEHRVAKQLLWLSGALLSKETAVALPLAAAALRLGTRMPLRPLVASGVLTASYIGARMISGLALPPANSSPLRYTVKEVVGRPFASLSVPYTGQELAGHPWLLGSVSVIIIAALVWLYCANAHAGARPVALASVVVIGVVPLWRFVAIGENLEGSRYLYLPLVGWSVLLVDLAAHSSAWRRWVCTSALIIVLVLPGTWYISQHLERWEQAARLRDAVLQSAAQVLSDSKCAVAHFRHVPDSLQGVHVFRNGFSEALGGRAVEAGGPLPPACEFTWTTDHFARTD